MQRLSQDEECVQTANIWWATASLTRAILEIGGRKLVAIMFMQIFIPVWIKIIMSNAPREVRNVSLSADSPEHRTAPTLTSVCFVYKRLQLVVRVWNENKTKTNAGTIYIKRQNKNKKMKSHDCEYQFERGVSWEAQEKKYCRNESKTKMLMETQSPRGTHSAIIFTTIDDDNNNALFRTPSSACDFIIKKYKSVMKTIKFT